MEVISRLLTIASVALSAIVALGFLAFAVDELGNASRHQQNEIVNPNAQQKQARDARHSGARRLLDHANDIVLKPFANVTHSSNGWVRRGAPALLALLLYGLGLGFLARAIRQRA